MLACLLGAASQFRQVKSEIDAFDPIFVEVDLAPRKWWHIRATQCGKIFLREINFENLKLFHSH